ncbi:MAG: RNA polymerase sigma factor [Planctomycetaceae bacterium]|nr:RNA polymerase sigma factor [Planctomycetaceae bacterium]
MTDLEDSDWARKQAADQRLVAEIRAGNNAAWADLLDRYQGRLTAFVESRLSNRSVAEDIVQEAFIGFLSSLPNYDGERPLEGYLFSICSYKVTDHLRREGRRPTIPLSTGDNSSGDWELPGSARVASSLARSGEQKKIEERVVAEALADHVARWIDKKNWIKLKCIELLIVRGWSNKKTSQALGLTEQQVANYKFDFVASMKNAIKKQNIAADAIAELSE